MVERGGDRVPLTEARRAWAVAGCLVLFWTLLKGYAGAQWGLLADEAYYWIWSQDLALSYYDQPGGIAWLIAGGTTLLGSSELAIRAPIVACGLICALLQGWATQRPIFAVAWWACIPSLAWLTLFATPDGLLLFGWTVCVACAVKGGRWWFAAAFGAAVATYAKLSGVGVLPLALIGAIGQGRDRPYRMQSALLYLVLASPLLLWNLGNEMLNFRFQLHEGLLHPHPPGASGPILQQLDQLGVVTPLAYIAVIAWAVRVALRMSSGSLSSSQRIAWSTSVPIMVFFLVCSPFAPSEAHWPAIAYVGAGFGLAEINGRLARLRDVGLGLGVACSLVLASHGFSPWLPLFNDPGTRLTRGPVLAQMVGQWATPEGQTIGGGAEGAGPLILTERYQEAALIQYYIGLETFKYPGCGRIDQYSRWSLPAAEMVLFVRPQSSGYSTCLDEVFIRRSGPNRIQGVDASNRLVGRWDIFEYESVHD